MTITSTRKIYTITNTKDDSTLTGELVTPGNTGYSISGTITNAAESANFYYSVDSNNKINKNINNVSADNEVEFFALLDITVAEINTEIEDKTIG